MNHLILARGLQLGAGTGAALGLLAGLALLAPAAEDYGLPRFLGVLVVYGCFAALAGAGVGVLDATAAVGVLLLVRPLIGPGLATARVVTAVAAAVPALVVASLYPVPMWGPPAFALVCAVGAAAWTRRILAVAR